MESNAGTQLLSNQFKIAEGFSDMYKRAQAIQESGQRMEQQKVRAADEHALSLYDQTDNANKLTDYNNKAAQRASQLVYDTAKLDLLHKDQLQLQEDDLAMTRRLAASRLMANEWSKLPEDDPVATQSYLNRMQALYGPDLVNPKTASRFNDVLGPVIASGKDRVDLAAQALENNASDLASEFDGYKLDINTGTPEEQAAARSKISAFIKRPDVAKARRSPKAQGERLNTSISGFWKDEVDYKQKLNSTKVTADGVVEAARLKAEKLPALPQFRAETLTKIGQASKDLDALEVAYKDGGAWGPIVGRIKGMNPYNVDAATLSALAIAAVPNLARGVFGEVGVLTDQDIANYRKLVPDGTKPPAVAAAIIQMLRTKLNDAYGARIREAKGQRFNTEGYPDQLGGDKVGPEAVDPIKAAKVAAYKAEVARRTGIATPAPTP